MPKIPLKWLEESIDLLPGSTAEDVAAALVKVGLEEEGIEGGSVTGPLVIGRVMSLVKEPQSNGKTINYCRVDVGEHNDPAGPGHKPDNKVDYPESKGIVCGAHNFVEGDFVVVVLPGAVLPGPFPIGGRKTYGHWSDGMICSAKELGLGEDHSGIIVLKSPSGESQVFAGASVPDEALVPGADAIPLLGLDEQTIEINVTPDRGYSFSVRGVAREYAHSTGQPLRDPAKVELTSKRGSGFEVDIDDQAPIRDRVGCDRFAARILRGFDPKASSPTWMKRRLDQAGMRPISLAVDVTNYVMLELGQPLHAYDLAKVHAPIQVRRAKPGETLVTLDDVERKLSPEDILVCDSPDGRGSRVIGLGGVMGGLETEISDTTTDVLLEAAHWDPITIARTARRHKLGSEASRRYERGVDTALPPYAIERALRLMQEFGGGELDEIYTDINDVEPVRPISMDASFPGTIVGVEYRQDVVVDSLEQVGCKVEVSGSMLSVTPPTWRPDLEAPVNLVEEVARLEGYESLPSVLPVAPPGRGLTHSQKVRRSVARSLAEAGLTEVLTYPFMSEQRLDDMLVPADDIRRVQAVRLANPLSAAMPLMRTGLTSTLIDAVKTNLGRGAQDVAVYEIGRAYRADHIGEVPTSFSGSTITPDDVERLNEALPGQPRRAAGIMVGNRVPASWNHGAEAFDWTDTIAMVNLIADACGVTLQVSRDPFPGLSTMPLHPGRAATFRLSDGTPVGVAGEMHPKVCENLGLPPRTVGFEVILDDMIAESEGRIAPASPVSQQVLAKEDFAFVVPDHVAAGDLVASVKSAGGELVEDAHVFDVYTGEQIGEGKKSLAVNVVMRAADRTLGADEVLAVREAIIAAAGEEFGAVLR
ncbi:phenylalanine--tRNA ligase subunit beta [Demequina zhanjiangensis]|uniref:Phenylalanine--tRNA ligase beta subunit n=1 Tax=Demequina zhanjiangensis TaxID=3051659 RepID=A0ABT8G3J9_9MICO|nr:phenylalanine--tRNA ligase subunit beta [Demequina sp. SYSU T00b26]MDN4473711.1 phenylalanine--tRNA ligase subunit beta [Demequina sp. SYSU T00b26]